jgi:outer membrane protein TolC
MRPDLMAARAGLAAERAGVEIAKAAYWPGVSAFYALTWQDDETRNSYDHWRIGVAASWEIFNWGRTDQTVRSAGARSRATAERIRSAEDRVRIELREAELAIAAAAESRRLAEARLRLAKEDVRISRLRFAEGVGTGTEVIDAESALAGADAARINAEVDLAVAMNRYRYLAGIEEPRR